MQYRPEVSKEGDRYRGRRRAAAPSRRRYAAVLATAAAGAGVVAFGAGATVDDAKSDPIVEVAAGAAVNDARAQAADRANRAERTMDTSVSATSADSWVLPLHDYDIVPQHAVRSSLLPKGLDLGGLPEGTPFASVHQGIVVQAGWNGAFGNSVTVDHGGGVKTVYAHASAVLVKVGQQVGAGEQIGLVGNSGYAYGTHLHLEVYVNDAVQNPMSWFSAKGIDFELEIEAQPAA
ncbi:M23 family metallopeptidase [Catellatospora bangladeshensis]|uniref:M23 family metallopeptidase n=1 Tax=Catellatospora bangladeshensis TaxID=310355 RepID=UPI0019418118|nr:M23 family metallopeptidase [Catellatospora bangladeshensis]